MVLVHEHEHPLHLIDMQPKFPDYEVVYDDDDELIAIRDFQGQCVECKKEINWFHRYYYKCSYSCDYLLHKLCAELPKKLKHPSHLGHTLFLEPQLPLSYNCDICERTDRNMFSYQCGKCYFYIHVNCAMASAIDGIIYHPSHRHPLVPTPKSLLCECNACGMKHEGIFYVCTTCVGFFIHIDCAFLPKTLLIQHSTNYAFFHTHPLTLSYSFPGWSEGYTDCRVCGKWFWSNSWLYKCEKCLYYAHIACATSRNEPFMSILSTAGTGRIFKNYKDSDYPGILNLPFHDESFNIVKHMFFKETEYGTSGSNDGNIKCNYHPHPLILVRSSSPRTNLLACHNPMKRIELLCNGCLRPITSMPFYKCVNDDQQCNFVLHEWCTRLPSEVQNHPCHSQHTLTLHPNASSKCFFVFTCAVCNQICNGFVYSCVQCDYHIDVSCSLIPEKITHEVHEGHVLSLVETRLNKTWRDRCRLCNVHMKQNELTFICQSCNIYLHVKCVLFLPRKIRHKYDKHPMSLSYFPVEDHKGDYFCENCEEGIYPKYCFYHCHQCAQSIHAYCAPVILRSERCTVSKNRGSSVYVYVNIKFGGIHKTKFHPHPLSFDQGLKGDSRCNECTDLLQYELIFKCLECNFSIDWKCCLRLSK